jgi:hypothetical protein
MLVEEGKGAKRQQNERGHSVVAGPQGGRGWGGS